MSTPIAADPQLRRQTPLNDDVSGKSAPSRFNWAEKPSAPRPGNSPDTCSRPVGASGCVPSPACWWRRKCPRQSQRSCALNGSRENRSTRHGKGIDFVDVTARIILISKVYADVDTAQHRVEELDDDVVVLQSVAYRSSLETRVMDTHTVKTQHFVKPVVGHSTKVGHGVPRTPDLIKGPFFGHCICT